MSVVPDRQPRLGEDLALPVKRHVKAVFPREDQRKERGAGEALLDRARWSWGLNDRRALGAPLLRADLAPDGEADRPGFQHLGLIGRAEGLQRAAALRAATLRRLDQLIEPLEVLGKLLAPHGLASRRGVLLGGSRLDLGNRRGELFEGKRELPRIGHLLGGVTELPAAQPCELQLQVLDLAIALDQKTLETRNVVRQSVGIKHRRIIRAAFSMCTMFV
jgi:hypothetical protein